MTLDEAIKHCEEVAKRLENSCKRDWMGENDKRCASEHRQLAEWLKELKMLKEYKKLADELMEEHTKAIKLRDEIIALRESEIKEMRTLIDIYKENDI